MIIRIVSAYGTKRFEVSETDNISKLSELIQNAFPLSNGDSWHLARDRAGKEKIKLNGTIRGHKIKHGDQLFLSLGQSARNGREEPMDVDSDSYTKSKNPASASRPNSSASIGPTSVVILEDDIDKQLDSMDGRILRKRNEQLCRHGITGKCIHCVPLEPYDQSYLEHCDPPIKFMSFHAYLRKLKGGADKGKFITLENISCRIKQGCKEHLPWPEGICTKCQPNAVTLSIQRYRHVDYVQFGNRYLMDRFLDYWRKTGYQRIGFLYGKYEHFENAPLGIKAVVNAIYEPPQISTSKSVKLLEESEESIANVNYLAEKLGLRRVGWIFTDLVAEDLKSGTVKHYRGTMDTFFLSAEECITAAHLQNLHPSPCKLSPDGTFGSKFVTVVVTGDSSNQIHFEAYQVSNVCMSLVRDNCLVPTYDAPELGYIRESSNEQYVPDVFYTSKDKYGNDITYLGRPLPVEYLLVDMPVAFPKDEDFLLAGSRNKQLKFPVENRETIGDLQNFNQFCEYIKQFSSNEFLDALSDFHLLLFLSTCDMLPLKEGLPVLLDSIVNGDKAVGEEFLKSEEWQTVMQLVEHTTDTSVPLSVPASDSIPNPNGSISASAGVSSTWNCQHCTYLNQSDAGTCEMCGLPPT